MGGGARPFDAATTLVLRVWMGVVVGHGEPDGVLGIVEWEHWLAAVRGDGLEDARRGGWREGGGQTGGHAVHAVEAGTEALRCGGACGMGSWRAGGTEECGEALIEEIDLFGGGERVGRRDGAMHLGVLNGRNEHGTGREWHGRGEVR